MHEKQFRWRTCPSGVALHYCEYTLHWLFGGIGYAAHISVYQYIYNNSACCLLYDQTSMRVFRWRDFCASVNDNNIIDNWVYHCILYDGSFPRRRLWLPSSPLPLLLLPVHCMVVSVRVWACERLSMGIEKPTCDYSLWQNQFGTHALHSILFSVFCLMHHHSPLTHSIHPPPPPSPTRSLPLCKCVNIFRTPIQPEY